MKSLSTNLFLRHQTKVVLELHKVGGLIDCAAVIEIENGAREAKRILKCDKVYALVHRAIAVAVAEETEEFVRSRSDFGIVVATGGIAVAVQVPAGRADLRCVDCQII